MYAALRHAIVMSRVARRQVLFGEIAMPDDPDDMIMHRPTLEQMLDGHLLGRSCDQSDRAPRPRRRGPVPSDHRHLRRGGDE